MCRGAWHRDRWHQASACLGRGSTQNTTTVTELLVGLRERGLDTTRLIFVGIDGAKALRTAELQVFDHPVNRHYFSGFVERPVCTAAPTAEDMRGLLCACPPPWA